LIHAFIHSFIHSINQSNFYSSIAKIKTPSLNNFNLGIGPDGEDLPDPDDVFKGIQRSPSWTLGDKGQKTATVTKASEETAKDTFPAANTEELDAQLVDH